MFPGLRLILLMRMMPAYLDHIQRWPRSLIVRYAGVWWGAYWSPLFGPFAKTSLSKRMRYLMILYLYIFQALDFTGHMAEQRLRKNYRLEVSLVLEVTGND